MPTTPGCQPSPCTSRAACPATDCSAAWASAESSIAASTCWRLRLVVSRVCARARASTGSSDSSRRSPRSEVLMRPAALMRGPRAKPQVKAVGRSRAAAASSSAAMPGRARRAMTRRPCTTSARFSPVNGITSQTVASATKSSKSLRSGSGRPAKCPARRSARRVATAARKAMAAAHTLPSPLVQSARLGFTVASTGGGGPSATWWSSTTTSARPCTAARAAAAAVPQSTQTTRVAPRSARDCRAGPLGP